MMPGSNPLLVRAESQDHQALQAIFDAMNEASESLRVQVQVALLPGIRDELPATGDTSRGGAGAWYSGELRSGDNLTFGARTERGFIGGYEIDVATDAGAADPHRSSAAIGETIHLTCTRVLGGQAVHVEGVLDLAKLKEAKTFDPDTPDLGEVDQPRLSIAQLAFSGVIYADAPLRVTLRGAQAFGDRTLFISASTTQDPAAPPTGWAVRDLSFLSSQGLALDNPEPGLLPSSAGAVAMTPTLTPATPGSLVGLLSDRGSPAADVARVFSTERLLLLPVTSPGTISKADKLIAAMEAPLLAQTTCALSYGSLSVELPTTHGRIARALVGEEQPWLVDYRTEIAPNTWMPSPVTEVAFDGLCLEARGEGGSMWTRYWVSDTPAVHIASSQFANLGALQHVERSYTAGSGRLDPNTTKTFLGLGQSLAVSLK